MKLWKKQNSVPFIKEAELRDQHTDSILRLAFMRIEQERADAMQVLVDHDRVGMSGEKMDAIYAKSKHNIAEMVRKEAHKAQHKRFVRKTLPRITRIAAAILLTFYLGATIAFATVHSVRIYFLQFLIKMEEKYAELSLVEDEGAVLDVPVNWKGSWYPSYIPEGFALSSIGKDGYKVFFTGQNEHLITFTEYDIDFTVNLDIEDSELMYIPLHGTRALMATKEGTNLITWAHYDRFYLLRADANPDEAIKIAEGVKRIR